MLDVNSRLVLWFQNKMQLGPKVLFLSKMPKWYSYVTLTECSFLVGLFHQLSLISSSSIKMIFPTKWKSKCKWKRKNKSLPSYPPSSSPHLLTHFPDLTWKALHNLAATSLCCHCFGPLFTSHTGQTAYYSLPTTMPCLLLHWQCCSLWHSFPLRQSPR